MKLNRKWRRRRDVAAIILGVLALMSVIVGSAFALEARTNEKREKRWEEFIAFCGTLDAEASHYDGDWVCIKDKTVVYT